VFHSFDQILQGDLCSLLEPTIVQSIKSPQKTMYNLCKRGYNYSNMVCSVSSFPRQQTTISLLSKLKYIPTIHKILCMDKSNGVQPMHKEGTTRAVVRPVHPTYCTCWSLQQSTLLLLECIMSSSNSLYLS
jgi:hypothetical protein